MLIQSTLLLGHLRRSDGVARWHIHTRVVGEEVPWAKQQSHGLNWHNGEVLRGRNVCDSECVPQNDVCVFGAGCSLGDPLGETQRGLTGCLRDVATCSPEFIVAV